MRSRLFFCGFAVSTHKGFFLAFRGFARSIRTLLHLGDIMPEGLSS